MKCTARVTRKHALRSTLVVIIIISQRTLYSCIVLQSYNPVSPWVLAATRPYICHTAILRPRPNAVFLRTMAKRTAPMGRFGLIGDQSVYVHNIPYTYIYTMTIQMQVAWSSFFPFRTMYRHKNGYNTLRDGVLYSKNGRKIKKSYRLP